MKTLLSTAALVIALGISSSAFAGGPPNCNGVMISVPGDQAADTPGAFISNAAKELSGAGTPPGSVVSSAAPHGGVGVAVQGGLGEDCGIGSQVAPPS